MTFKPISITPEQAQFLLSRQFSIEETARIFNVPPHMLKDLTKSSYALSHFCKVGLLTPVDLV